MKLVGVDVAIETRVRRRNRRVNFAMLFLRNKSTLAVICENKDLDIIIYRYDRSLSCDLRVKSSHLFC